MPLIRTVRVRGYDTIVENLHSHNATTTDSQPLIQKARKLESKASPTGPTPSPTPQPNGTPRHLSLTLNGAPTAPQEDPYAGLSVIERKLKEDKYVKVRQRFHLILSKRAELTLTLPSPHLHSTLSPFVHQHRAPPPHFTSLHTLSCPPNPSLCRQRQHQNDKPTSAATFPSPSRAHR